MVNGFLSNCLQESHIGRAAPPVSKIAMLYTNCLAKSTSASPPFTDKQKFVNLLLSWTFQALYMPSVLRIGSIWGKIKSDSILSPGKARSKPLITLLPPLRWPFRNRFASARDTPIRRASSLPLQSRSRTS